MTTFAFYVQARGELGSDGQTYEPGSDGATKNVFWNSKIPQHSLIVDRSLMGITYTLTYPAEHPLRLSTTPDGIHAGGVEYTDGVTVTSSTSLTFTAKVLNGQTPDLLYYYCSNHSGMGAGIAVKAFTYPSATAPVDDPPAGSQTSPLGAVGAGQSFANIEEAPESSKYGLRLLSPDNKIRLDTTDRVYRLHSYATGIMIDRDQTSYIPVPGLTSDGTWLVIADTHATYDWMSIGIEIEPDQIKVYKDNYSSWVNYDDTGVYFLMIYRL